MKTLKITLIVIASILLAGVVVFGYYGGFKRVKFEIAELGGDTLVYREMNGDYALSGQVMDEVYNVLKEDYNISTTKGFGIYYDNPRQTAKEKRRYDAGCIVNGADSAQLAAIAEKYKVSVLHRDTFLTSSFPYKGKASVIMSIAKVYPAMINYFEKNLGVENFGPVMEIYDPRAGKIYYRTYLLDAAPQ